MYWETPAGGVKSPYLDVCLQTIAKWCGDLKLHVVDEVTIRDFLPDLRTDLSRLSLNHRSDYYRSRLVHRYGGLWLDADVIALRPLDELLQGWGGRDVALYGRGPGNLSAGCFAALPGSALVADWMKRQDEALDSGEEMPWNGLGKAPLVAAATHHDFHQLPAEKIAPLPWRDWRTLLSKWRSPHRYLRSNPIVFMLYNKFLHDAFGDMSAPEILHGDMLISKLFRVALEVPTRGSG